jgi:hypothetical protein
VTLGRGLARKLGAHLLDERNEAVERHVQLDERLHLVSLPRSDSTKSAERSLRCRFTRERKHGRGVSVRRCFMTAGSYSRAALPSTLRPLIGVSDVQRGRSARQEVGFLEGVPLAWEVLVGQRRAGSRRLLGAVRISGGAASSGAGCTPGVGMHRTAASSPARHRYRRRREAIEAVRTRPSRALADVVDPVQAEPIVLAEEATMS